MKYCNSCQSLKPLTSFYKCKTHKDGLQYKCKDCIKVYTDTNKKHIKIYKKEYCKKNSNQKREYDKLYYVKNHDYILDRVQQYTKNNLEKHRIYMRNYMFNRSQNDVMFRLNSRLRNAVGRTLHGEKVGRHWEDIVGYTLQDLKQHLESKFTEDMTWDNYGKWHIDHIKPSSNFKFTSYNDEEFKECWKLENLQPLWARDNILKSNKIGVINDKSS